MLLHYSRLSFDSFKKHDGSIFLLFFFFLTLTMFCILAINCNDCEHDTRSYSVVLQQRLNNIVGIRLGNLGLLVCFQFYLKLEKKLVYVTILFLFLFQIQWAPHQSLCES